MSNHHLDQNKHANSEVLVYPDGRKVTFLDEGIDDHGPYLRVEHLVKTPGALNGPHWHPYLSEMFLVQEGTMRFLLDRKEIICKAGDTINVLPDQIHQFWNTSPDQLRVIHEIRPPGQHRRMFELIHHLECSGKMNRWGIPRNPLWMGLLWAAMDGYIVGPPQWLQTFFFGGLARIANIARLEK